MFYNKLKKYWCSKWSPHSSAMVHLCSLYFTVKMHLFIYASMFVLCRAVLCKNKRQTVGG